MNSLGDMAQAFASSRNNHHIKTRLFRLSNELSTGRVEDLSAHLRGDTKRLADVDRRILVGNSQLAGAKSVAQTFEVMQLALGRVNSAREDLTIALSTMALENGPLEIGRGASAGRVAFEVMVNALNTRFADQALFSGAVTDGQALASPESMLDDIRTLVAGLATATDVQTAITDWFAQPGGRFDTMGYLGDTGARPTRRLDDETTVVVSARADDPAIRGLLTAAAMAALADDPAVALSNRDRNSMLTEAKMSLISSTAPMVQFQAALGAQEGQIEKVSVGLSAQISALSILRNQMIGADPFQTASELEQVQIQLETHYTVTARLSRLSLAEYLR